LSLIYILTTVTAEVISDSSTLTLYLVQKMDANAIITTAEYDIVDSANYQTTPQPLPTQLNVLRLFYQVHDGNIYHVTCQDFPQALENFASCDENYDYEFFLQSSSDSAAMSYVTCKLLSLPLLVNILNKKIYGMDFDAKELKRGYLLTLHQKLNLEQSLKKDFLLHFTQHPNFDSKAELNSNKI
jgi:hypothetical protein